jgi:hypothetical protein
MPDVEPGARVSVFTTELDRSVGLTFTHAIAGIETEIIGSVEGLPVSGPKSASSLVDALSISAGATFSSSAVVPLLLLGETNRTIVDARTPRDLGTEESAGERCAVVETNFGSASVEVLIGEASHLLRVFRIPKPPVGKEVDDLMRRFGLHDDALPPPREFRLVVEYEAEIVDP